MELITIISTMKGLTWFCCMLKLPGKSSQSAPTAGEGTSQEPQRTSYSPPERWLSRHKSRVACGIRRCEAPRWSAARCWSVTWSSWSFLVKWLSFCRTAAQTWAATRLLWSSWLRIRCGKRSTPWTSRMRVVSCLFGSEFTWYARNILKPWPNGTPNSSKLEPSYKIKSCINSIQVENLARVGLSWESTVWPGLEQRI